MSAAPSLTLAPPGLDEAARREAVPGSQFPWVGPGSCAFLLPVSRLPEVAGGDPAPRLYRVATVAEIEARQDARLDAHAGGRGRPGQARRSTAWTAEAAARASETSLRTFLSSGAGDCLVLELPLEPGSRGGRWLGSDAGPGERTGVHSLLDVESVGSVVVPPLPPAAVEPFRRFTRENTSWFFWFEALPDDSRRRDGGSPRGSDTLLPLSNAAALDAVAASGLCAGELLAWLVRRDFHPSSLGAAASGADRLTAGPMGSRGPRREDLAAVGAQALLYLEGWRRWAGLRRSLDLGSRWVVFERAAPGLAGRLEREIRSFLHALTVEGLLAAPVADGDEVRCSIEAEEVGPDGAPAEARVVVAVKARLRGPYGRVLERYASEAEKILRAGLQMSPRTGSGPVPSDS